MVYEKSAFISSMPSFYSTPRYVCGSRVIPENVKIDIHFENFPSELIYALWSLLVGWRGAVINPLPFSGAYTHIPQDFNNPKLQLTLAYTVLYAIFDELNHQYTAGQIGFTEMTKQLKFGTPTQTKAIRDLLEKFKDEPCMDTTIGEVLEHLRIKERDKQWDKGFRKDLRARLSKLLDEVGYWDKVIVKRVE